MQWTTTPTELIQILRAAFISLVPVAERARIPWREGEAYDDWDELAEALYDKFVVRPLQWAVLESGTPPLQAPAYDLLVDSYADVGVLIVRREDLPASPYQMVFHSLCTTEEPFDTVGFRQVDSLWLPVGDRIHRCPFERTQFELCYLGIDGARRTADQLTIEL